MEIEINNILVIGSNGQIGSVLTPALREIHGKSSVVASDIYKKQDNADGLFEILDATDFNVLENIVKKYAITQIYHLAAILSAKGEENPQLAWDVNVNSLMNVLEVSIKHNIKKVFYPSSIAVFGSNASLFNTPQNANLNPATIYGVSKVAGENLAQYYFLKYGLDVRSLRYPGIIGYQSLPGGGTTDYAVDIYHKAVSGDEFNCFLESDTRLPMIYMDDAIKATISLMEASPECIKVRTSYNLSGMSFSPEEIYLSIKKHYPNFKISYKPDFRQNIANSWPRSIDDSSAKNDWNWKPSYDLKNMTRVMISKLSKRYKSA
ncbi:NAD-dependent epimerase/dehydratase family protein [Flaviramulus sp. BrNp1-15]|uniref:NAD-dependent epimerase/dehydratase family protein n=1 Tax=Flaviramulus sp. BrNp1-15 TaxID=2916754 RepID=UPI001EE94D3B|nr:NAD-dependent epimerase/dehydratase family protein [Flaviramulus sp. BrNp1-15]ULC58288.1 NAD-dependent epimerase/dehydratase family protein [Flaviramulus sp. BrNp1-15]